MVHAIFQARVDLQGAVCDACGWTKRSGARTAAEFATAVRLVENHLSSHHRVRHAKRTDSSGTIPMASRVVTIGFRSVGMWRSTCDQCGAGAWSENSQRAHLLSVHRVTPGTHVFGKRFQ